MSILTLNHPSLHLKKKGNLENMSTHSKRMSKLEQCLEALTSQKGLQEAGVVWPYPSE